MSTVWYDSKMEPLDAAKFLKRLHSSDSQSSDGSDKSYEVSSTPEDTSATSTSEEESTEDSSSDDNVKGKKGGGGGTRKRRRCPLLYCKSRVVHLPRHLEDVHGWSKTHARTALIRYGMRKTYSFSHPKNAPQKKKQKTEEGESESKGSKDYHHYRYCPQQGCTALVKRLPPHLRKVHNLSPEEVKVALSKVEGKRLRHSHRVPVHERRQQWRNTIHSESDQPSVSQHRSETVSSIVISDSLSEEKSNDKDATPEIVNDVLKKFKMWLQSADGGQLDAKTSEQHYKQMVKLLNVIDEGMEVTSLFDHQLINKKFLEGYAKTQYHPKTTQSYLMSLRHFYSFSLATELCESISNEKIVGLKEKVTRWSSSFRRSSAKRHWEKQEEDLNALISPDQIKEFERSEAARNAVCLLGKLSGAHSIEITQAQYTLLRDFLIVEISIDNGNRAGALANMKVGEFKIMKDEGGERVILVKDHKTLATHGPARIVLSQKLAGWLKIFVTEVRSRISGSSNDNDRNVFLSWNGEALASSQISKAMRSIWKKAEISGTPSSTILRKSAVTGVHSTTDSSASHSDLADLMAHNVSTAQHYYKLTEKSKSSVKASKLLRNVMRGEIQHEEMDKEENSVAPPTEECQSKASRASWSPEAESLVKDLFQGEIVERSISLDTVKSKISDHPVLQNEDPKRVLDKVRSQWRYAKGTQPLELPSEQETLEQRVKRTLVEPDNIIDHENDSDIAPSTSVKSGLKNMLTSTDLERVTFAFKDMIVKSAAIQKIKIKEVLEKESWGRDILKKVSVDTVMNRIKYERRVHRRVKNL